MIPKVIKNLQEYEEALTEYDTLLDADPDPGTPDADKLELLSHLIGDYEEREFPIDLPDPIEAIKFRMEQQNLIQRDLVPYIGSPSKVSEVMNRKRPLSLNMIRALHEHLHIPAEVLMRSKGAKIPEKASINWNRFPLKYMYERGWFKNAPKAWSHAKDMAEELMRPLWEQYVDNCEVFPLSRQSKSVRASENTNIYAWAAWAARVVDRSVGFKLANSYEPIDEHFMNNLASQSIYEDGPCRVRKILYNRGIHLVIEQRLPKTYIDGAAILLKNGTPVIALTIRQDRIDNFWFSLMHELSHLKLHLKKGCDIFIDNLHYHKNKSKYELEADSLAEKILVPCKYPMYPTLEQMVRISERINRHPAILAGQIQHRTKHYERFREFVNKFKVSHMFQESLGN